MKVNEDIAQAKAWIASLPNGGGAWGEAMLARIGFFEKEIADAQELQAELSRQIHDLNDQAKARRRLLRAALKAAQAEAEVIFAGAKP